MALTSILGPVLPGMEEWRELVTDRFVLSADLGQAQDYTALAILQHRRTEKMHWKGAVEHVSDTFDVRHLERLPLGLSYVDQIDAVRQLLSRPPLNQGCELTFDATGVGRPVCDLAEDVGLRPTKIMITAGTGQNFERGMWHVSKQILISTLDAHLHSGELRFAAGLTEAAALGEELKDFRRKVSDAGRFSYAARTGRHDDLVLSIAIGLWWLVRKSNRPTVRSGTFEWL